MQPLGDWPDVALRLGAAALLGGVVGLDRELQRKPAGLRTHALVSIGAALFALLTLRFSTADGKADVAALSRVVQGVVAGIGFLGAGVILQREHAQGVRGLTTAASVWAVAAVGLACGAACWVEAVVAVVLIVLILGVGGVLEWRFLRPHHRHVLAPRETGPAERAGDNPGGPKV
jgi:putative Mg2+ transporter-C (MgtC) family protein